jgi:hypothetical protein
MSRSAGNRPETVPGTLALRRVALADLARRTRQPASVPAVLPTSQSTAICRLRRPAGSHRFLTSGGALPLSGSNATWFCACCLALETGDLQFLETASLGRRHGFAPVDCLDALARFDGSHIAKALQQSVEPEHKSDLLRKAVACQLKDSTKGVCDRVHIESNVYFAVKDCRRRAQFAQLLRAETAQSLTAVTSRFSMATTLAVSRRCV